MKLRNFFYLLLALPLFIAGCTEPGTDEPAKKDVVLTLVSDQTMEFGNEGGNGIIAYKLENAPEGAQVSATCEADWVTNLKVGTNVTFKVDANAGAARETKIVVSYEAKSFEVTVAQAEFDVQITSTIFTGNFVGYTQNNTLNYTLYLSDYGFDSYGRPVAGGSYYLLDLYYGEEPEVDAEGYIVFPAGTYNYDAEGTLNGFTINGNGSAYFKINDEGTDYAANQPFDSATLEVTADGVTLVAYVNNIKHTVTFDSTPKLYVGQPIIPGDYTMDVIACDYYGTQYSSTYNYMIYLSNKGFGEAGNPLADGIYYMVDLYGIKPVIDDEGYLTVPAGTYTFDPNDGCGEWSVGNYYSGYFSIDSAGEYYSSQAKLDNATVVVTENSVVIECVIQGRNHKVTYNGAPKVFVGVPVKDATVEAKYIIGEYYANQYSVAYNYMIYLSDLGFTSDNQVLGGGSYYSLDLYGVEPNIDAEGNLTIPAGTYTFDFFDGCAEWSMGNYYSDYRLVNDACTAYVYNLPYSDGIVEVTENGITATLVIEDATHIVTFNGAPTFNINGTRAAAEKKDRLSL